MKEQSISPERLHASPSMKGLQARMELIGSGQDVLNISNRKILVTKEQLGKHEDAFQAALSGASTNERQELWKQRGGSYEEQMSAWRESFVGSVESRKNYFSKPGQEDFFKGLGIDVSHCDTAQAQEFYTTYFSSGKTESRTDVFIASVLKQIAKPDGTYDSGRLAAHAEGIRSLAGAFGKDGAEIVMQKLGSAVEISNNPDKFVEEAQKAVNAIPADSHEEHLVSYLARSQKIAEKTVHEPIKKMEARLTPELAADNPAVFMESLFKNVNDRYPLLYNVWRFAEKEGLVSPQHLKLDPNNWMSESDTTDGIILGTKPMSQGERYRIMFNDEAFDYPSEVVYRLSHELSHKIITHIAIKENQSSEFNHLLSTLKDLNREKGKVVTALASQDYYRSKGLEVQGIEDMTELVSMYLQDPRYLKQYLDFLSNKDYRDIREKYHLVHLGSDTAKNLYDTVERGLSPLFKEMIEKNKLQGKEPEIKVLDDKEAENILRITLPPEDPKYRTPDTLTLETKNRIAAQRYIQRLDEMFEEAKKDPARRDAENMITTEIGMRRKDEVGPVNNYYDSTSVLTAAFQRYKLPVIFLNHGGHENLVLRVLGNPETEDCKVVVYDPMHKGEGAVSNKSGVSLQTDSLVKIIDIQKQPAPDIEIDGEVQENEKSPIWKMLLKSENAAGSDLFNVTSLESTGMDERGRAAWHDLVANGQYDLALQGDADFTRETYTAKAQAFQTQDYHNCVPYSLWAGLIRTAAKYSADDCPEAYKGFFTEGLAQFERDFGFPIATRKELMANDFIKAK